MIHNKIENSDLFEVNKHPRLDKPPIEIPWLTLEEWKRDLREIHALSSFSDKVAKIKATMVERIQKVELNGKIQELAGHVLWLDLTHEIPLYIVVENGINESYFAKKATRRKVLGISTESLDITIYAQAQNDFSESGKVDEELRVKLKGAMARKSRPLLSLKWDSLGQVMEIVWVQSFKGFDHYRGIAGSDLKKIVDLFENLLPPERMTILADQAKSGGLLLRKVIPLTKDLYIYGPGYYGSWGFIPSNCWKVKNLNGEEISQSRILYYSAVQTLREVRMDDLNVSLSGDQPLYMVTKHFWALIQAGSPEARSGFDKLIRQIYENKQPSRIEMAKQILLNTVIWEKSSGQRYEKGYTSYCIFEKNILGTDFPEESLSEESEIVEETYKSLVSKALKFPKSPSWLT